MASASDQLIPDGSNSLIKNGREKLSNQSTDLEKKTEKIQGKSEASKPLIIA